MRNYLDNRWRPLLLLVFWGASGLTFAEATRVTTLPAYCKALYPKLIPAEGRRFTQSEIEELLRFSRLSPQAMDEAVNRLGIRPARSLLEKLMILRSEMKGLPFELIPPELQPSLEEITHAFPKSVQNPELFQKNREALSRRVFETALDRTGERVASYLGEASNPSERLETFKYFISTLDSYDASWLHQTKIDGLIDLASGIETRRISENIQRQNRKEFNEKHQGEETYSFAGPELLLTPYTEILNIFQGLGLKSGDKVVDLGAGFGRVGLALATKNPGVTVTGYEIVKDRVAEGARVARDWGLEDRVHLLEQNLADPRFLPEAADIYFAFNPVSGTTFDKILEDLRKVGLRSGKRFRLVLFGPSPFEKADAQAWLREVKSAEIPQGEDIKVYEFVPERATHTEVIEPQKKNPFELSTETKGPPHFPKSIPLDSRELSLEADSTSSFMSPRYLAAWAQTIPHQISRWGNLKIIHTSKGSGSEKKETYLEPLGGSPQDKAEAISAILAERKSRGIQAEFIHLSEEVAKALASTPEVLTESDSEFSDYVYHLRDLAELKSTKRLRDRSSQAEQFKASHPDVTLQVFSRLSEEAQSDFLTSTKGFLSSWTERKMSEFSGSESDRQDLVAESKAAEVLRSTLVEKDTVQIALRSGSNGPIIAYANGEIRPGPQGKRVLVIYVQKSDGTKNSIQFLNQALAQEVLFHPETYGQVELVNMMDASRPGLKQFKKQYGPDPLFGQAFRASASPSGP